MNALRARLAALPLLALLIVAVALGAAAGPGGAGPTSTDQQASIVAMSVILTLLGISVALFVLGLSHADPRLQPAFARKRQAILLIFIDRNRGRSIQIDRQELADRGAVVLAVGE